MLRAVRKCGDGSAPRRDLASKLCVEPAAPGRRSEPASLHRPAPRETYSSGRGKAHPAWFRRKTATGSATCVARSAVLALGPITAPQGRSTMEPLHRPRVIRHRPYLGLLPLPAETPSALPFNLAQRAIHYPLLRLGCFEFSRRPGARLRRNPFISSPARSCSDSIARCGPTPSAAPRSTARLPLHRPGAPTVYRPRPAWSNPVR